MIYDLYQCTAFEFSRLKVRRMRMKNICWLCKRSWICREESSGRSPNCTRSCSLGRWSQSWSQHCIGKLIITSHFSWNLCSKAVLSSIELQDQIDCWAVAFRVSKTLSPSLNKWPIQNLVIKICEKRGW